ncbi:MAG: peptidase domain-containing ABC transporter, partial [Bacteroidota bacterium]
LSNISEAAEQLGFQTLAAKVSFQQLQEELPLPAIVHIRQQHFVVVYRTTRKKVYIADPESGKYELSIEEFKKQWARGQQDGQHFGVVLLLETTPEFFERDGEPKKQGSWAYLSNYLLRHKRLIVQILIGLVLVSFIQLAFPFLIQALVDEGINKNDLNFVYLILAAQFMLFFSQNIIEYLRSWILLHVGTRINVNLISDFLMKLMRLPMRFFDTRLTGDLLQRIYDNERVERFLSAASLAPFFSLFNLVIFGVVLAWYNMPIFWLYLGGTVLYIIWILWFLRKRQTLDNKRFAEAADNQRSLIELINGMQEIKLHNAERQKRWNWESVQAKLFRINVAHLRLDQWQRTGARFINEAKNIVITVLAAKAVIDNVLTLGQMLAIQYIIGQLNGPIDQLMNFIRSAQDAKISLDRMSEVHNAEEEQLEGKITILPAERDIDLREVWFQYGGPKSHMVLRDINLHIPEGKTTAIVGTSGSGKTTLLKLLLHFYEPTRGSITVGDLSLSNINDRLWRKRCGVVMQDGFIFSDTIARNIALGEEIIDEKKLLEAGKIVRMQSIIETLPLGYNTKIGPEGVSLSKGQIQRILIARAIYKNPEYLFFDEATNALDAYNEMIIMDNLEDYFKRKTVVIVAHRLSTVRNADNIIVMERGEVIEQGTHDQLTASRGAYYYLVRNQLELGA